MSNGVIGCKQLVARQDILNIQWQLNIDSIKKKNTNDLMSTLA